MKLVSLLGKEASQIKSFPVFFKHFIQVPTSTRSRSVEDQLKAIQEVYKLTWANVGGCTAPKWRYTSELEDSHIKFLTFCVCTKKTPPIAFHCYNRYEAITTQTSSRPMNFASPKVFAQGAGDCSSTFSDQQSNGCQWSYQHWWRQYHPSATELHRFLIQVNPVRVGLGLV